MLYQLKALPICPLSIVKNHDYPLFVEGVEYEVRQAVTESQHLSFCRKGRSGLDVVAAQNVGHNLDQLRPVLRQAFDARKWNYASDKLGNRLKRDLTSF